MTLSDVLSPRHVAAIAWSATVATAQVVPGANPSPDPATEDPVMISPFQVTTTRDTGYTATNTLAGTRMNSELWDTPAAISVFTTEFLDDTGVLDVKAALDYALNTSEDTTDYTGQNLASNDINVQIRGFVGAAIGRNYFAWSLSSDRYNIERIDFSRGPNSVLFGVGAPGGIINTSTKRARIGRDQTLLRTRFGSWEDYRGEIDFGRTLVKDKLAVRANLLWQDKNDWREFKGSDRRSGALAATYRPFKNTEIRFDGEYGDVDQVIAQPYPAGEVFLAWVNAGRPISQTYGQAVAGAGVNGNGVRLTWDPFSGVGPVSWNASRISNGGPQATALANVRAAVLDESIHPRWGAISGPGWTADFHYFNYAAFVEQRVGENLAFEAAFNRQKQVRFQDRPQGFGQVSLRLDPNALMPLANNAAGVVTATAPNPNVGRFFTEGAGHALIVNDATIDDYRLTGSYRLDLTPRNAWFGRHDIAGLLTRTNVYNRNDEFGLRNITPIGNATYPLDVTHQNNQIVRRAYIDFSNPDPRWHGLYDYRKHRLTGQNGVTEGFVRTGDDGRDSLSRTDTSMLAGQSRWWGGRVVVTGGLRRDRLRVWQDSMDFDGDGDTQEHRDPVTGIYPRRQRTGAKDFSQGDTKTIGTVVHPVNWLGIFYNQSDSFRPQGAEDINNGILGNRHGDGKDYGVRLRLLDNRFNLSIARYEVEDANQSVGRDNNFINFINSIWRTLGMPERQALTTSRDSQDLIGEGWEVELTANPTPNWRLAVNGAQTRQILSSVQPRNGAYIEANRALWTQRGSTPLGAERHASLPATDPVTGGPATVMTALRATEEIYARITAAAGQTRRQLREYTGNFFTTYTFRRSDSFLKGFSVGGGANYRGEGVVGYDTSNNNTAIYGDAYTLANAMAAYEWRLRGRSIKVQLNVDNLLNEDAPIVTDADESQSFRFILQTPRRFALTTTINF